MKSWRYYFPNFPLTEQHISCPFCHIHISIIDILKSTVNYCPRCGKHIIEMQKIREKNRETIIAYSNMKKEREDDFFFDLCSEHGISLKDIKDVAIVNQINKKVFQYCKSKILILNEINFLKFITQFSDYCKAIEQILNSGSFSKESFRNSDITRVAIEIVESIDAKVNNKESQRIDGILSSKNAPEMVTAQRRTRILEIS